MPAVSFYLRQEVLDAVRAKAKSENLPVSRLISQAVERLLESEERRRAKSRLLETLTQRPLGV